MNGYYRNPTEEFKYFFRSGSTLSILILINIGVWLLVKVVGVSFFLANIPDSDVADAWMLSILALPAYIPSIFTHPWTFITYMFFHISFFHILFNMLWLFWFGKIFLEYLTSRQLLHVYILGGIAGGLLYILAFNLFPVFQEVRYQSLALGASASVMAIVTAISFYVPNYTIPLIFFGRTKIIVLALVLFIIDFFSISGGNAGGHIAHIGGAIWGFSYATFLNRKKGSNFGSWRFKFDPRFTNFWNSKNTTSQTTSQYHKRPTTDDEYNRDKVERQRRTDVILEKISKGGYESLTKEEKEFLFKVSNKK